MKKSGKITSLTQLIKVTRRRLKALKVGFIGEFKRDDGEDFLLRISIKIVWFFLVFRVMTCVLSQFQKDIFINTTVSILIKYSVENVVLSRLIKDDFLSTFSGAMLKYLLVTLLFFYTAFFIWPGIFIQSFTQALKRYEEK